MQDLKSEIKKINIQIALSITATIALTIIALVMLYQSDALNQGYNYLQLNPKYYTDVRTKANTLPYFETIISSTYPKEDLKNPIVRLEKEGQFYCTAFIVADQYAITASHCVVDKNNKVDFNGFNIVSNDRASSASVEVVAADLYNDYTLLIGNFAGFDRLSFYDDAASNATTFEFPYAISCGYPRGIKDITCYKQTQCRPYFDTFECVGLLYKGQSGGPFGVVNPISGELMVTGINHAISAYSTIFSPLLGILTQFNLKKGGE